VNGENQSELFANRAGCLHRRKDHQSSTSVHSPGKAEFSWRIDSALKDVCASGWQMFQLSGIGNDCRDWYEFRDFTEKIGGKPANAVVVPNSYKASIEVNAHW
jgi:hypothetical protein